MKNLIAALLFSVFLCCSLTDKEKQLFVINGHTMGTTFSIKIVEQPAISAIDKEGIEKEIKLLLIDVNQKMSTFVDSSEISLFNKYNQNGWFPVSPELVMVVEKALEISRESGDAFDITVGPLVNLWGFGPEGFSSDVPEEKEIAKRKKNVGYKNLHAQQNPPALKKDIPGLYCDLSAIAKGYGVDKVADYIEAQGYDNYLVEIGGEIRAKGLNASDHVWRIGVSTPDDQFGIYKVVTVTNTGLATSGDYRNYFEKDGIRYSHTIDPSTGRPITHKLASVTVIDSLCMDADGYATAIDVLGPERGYEFAMKKNLPVFMLVKSDSGFSEVMTPAFENILKIQQ